MDNEDLIKGLRHREKSEHLGTAQIGEPSQEEDPDMWAPSGWIELDAVVQTAEASTAAAAEEQARLVEDLTIQGQFRALMLLNQNGY